MKSRTVRRAEVAYMGTLHTLGTADGALRRSRRMVELNPTPARVSAYRRNVVRHSAATYSADLAQYRYMNALGRVQNGG